jgi:hypothetical protein
MQNDQKSNFCLVFFLGCSIVSLCLCLFILIGSIWMGNEVYRAANASPTPINSCRGMMNFMEIPETVKNNYKSEKIQDLAIYTVQGEELSDPEFLTIEDTSAPLQQDTQVHQLLWQQFIMLIPAADRKPLDRFVIFTDGTGHYAAQASEDFSYEQEAQGYKLKEKWTLRVDLADFSTIDKFTPYLVHEYGHFLTLQVSQIEYMEKIDTCAGYSWEYEGGGGCARSNSYLEKYFHRYWAEIFSDWKAIDSLGDPDLVNKGLDAYFNAHSKNFISRYAVTNPREDIAESWRAFLLMPKPMGATLADQKVLFFYEFPELVELQTTIVNRLCDHYHFSPPEDLAQGSQ